MITIREIIRSIGMDIYQLYSMLNKTKWVIVNGSGIQYSFLDLEIIGNNILAGMVYIGDKLVDFELSALDIVYNTFKIGKYIFLLKSNDEMTVFVEGDDTNHLQLERCL